MLVMIITLINDTRDEISFFFLPIWINKCCSKILFPQTRVSFQGSITLNGTALDRKTPYRATLSRTSLSTLWLLAGLFNVVTFKCHSITVASIKCHFDHLSSSKCLSTECRFDQRSDTRFERFRKTKLQNKHKTSQNRLCKDEHGKLRNIYTQAKKTNARRSCMLKKNLASLKKYAK